ncbi:hypothetical protein [Micromonospora sonneratiae]|uniref:Transglycosylase SLT domain-containing protein n=1 Tax=Micromonospora sonneratiae TaxID=1184706 RepID=A0ABW3Y7A2_9ACTN
MTNSDARQGHVPTRTRPDRRTLIKLGSLLATLMAVGAGITGTYAASADETRTVRGTVTARPEANIRDGVEGAIIGNAAHGTGYTVVCYRSGPNQISGSEGASPYWDRVVDENGNDAGWIADVWLDTGGDITSQVDPCREGQLGAGIRNSAANRQATDAAPRTVTGRVTATEHLAVKTGPSLAAPRTELQLLVADHSYTVACYREGDEVTGDGGTNRYWDLVVDPTDPRRAIGFVADAWLDTGGDITAQVERCGEVPLAPQISNTMPGPAGAKDVLAARAVRITSSEPAAVGAWNHCRVGRHTDSCLTPITKIDLVVNHANAAGIDPRLLLAILVREEGSFGYSRPWEDIKTWVLQDEASRGLGNMSKATFEETRRKHPELFGSRQFHELTGDDELSIQTTAWHLRDLLDQLPTTWPGDYTRDELLAIGYNAGASNMLPTADGTGEELGDDVRNYLGDDRGVRTWWSRADELICRSGVYLCLIR